MDCWDCAPRRIHCLIRMNFLEKNPLLAGVDHKGEKQRQDFIALKPPRYVSPFKFRSRFIIVYTAKLLF